MRGVLISGLVACAAVALSFASSNGANVATATAEAAEPVAIVTESALAGIPSDAVPPLGECRIWYNELPVSHQPARMECEHAHWLAQRWGGRVISNDGQDAVELAAYEGRNDFTGVPVEALPRAGYCRAWIDGEPLSVQPAQSDCREARRTATQRGGRVLFMPL